MLIGPEFVMSAQQFLEQAELQLRAGQAAKALQLCEQATAALTPTAGELALLAEILLALKRRDEAIGHLERAVVLDPNFAEAHGILGRAMVGAGQWDRAEACFRRALSLKPDSAQASCSLGDLLATRRRWPAAILELRNAVALDPNMHQANFHLGRAYLGIGKLKEAADRFRRAAELAPSFFEAWQALGDVQLNRRENAEAVAAYRRANALHQTAPNYLNLGSALAAVDELDQSVAVIAKAIELAPKWSDPQQAMGSALSWCGNLDAAITAFRKAVELDPKNDRAHSALLYTMLFHGGYSPQKLRDEHVEWARRHTADIIALPPPPNDRSPDRRLKIGYVSPNFRHQAVSNFVLPIIASRNAWETEIFCYSDAIAVDARTAELHRAADEWRDTAALGDEQLANLIRQDRIDILVDLTGHIGHGRLKAFACKPAPVQVTYIGYQATTGLGQIDYFLTDEWSDPSRQTEAFLVEKPFRLPQAFFCYSKPVDAPDVGPLPATEAGYITFGCMNNLAKVTPTTLDLWAKTMTKVPASRLMMLTPNSRDVHERLRSALADRGLSANRVEFAERTSFKNYLARYNRIDIALDPVPFNGHTTTCDAAWMGCPTVSLAGKTYAHRYGCSVMRNVNLSELIAENPQQYVDIAASLALDVGRLADIRASLRQRMIESIITDGPRFTGHLEAAYREMWRRWCASD